MSQTDSIEETCFLCLNKVVPVTKVGRGRGRPSSGKVLVSTQGPKVLLSYLLDGDTLQSKSVASAFENDILIACKSGRLKLCPNCEACAEKITQLHLELEAHQLKIIDLLKRIQHCLQKSTGVQGLRTRLEENGTGGAGGSLREMFQDMIYRNFLARKLSDGHEVRLERLANIGKHLPPRVYDETLKVEIEVKEEPEDPVDNNEDSYFPSPSSPLFQDDPLSSTEIQAEVDITTAPIKCLESSIPPLAKRTRSLRKSERLQKSPRVNQDVDNHHPPSTTPDIPSIGVNTSVSEVVDVGVHLSESDNYTFRKRERTQLKKKWTGCDRPPKFLASKKCKNDEDYDPSSEEELSENESEPDDKPQPKKKKPPPNNKPKTVRIRNRPTKTRWTCDICLEPVPFKQMQDHLQTHPQFEKFYYCSVKPPLKKVFGTFKGYVWHLLEPQCCKSEPSLACELCPDRKTFKRRDLSKHLYEDHKLDHPRPTCPDCSQQFYDLRSLKKHKIIEHERRFVCEYCSKGFEREFFLKQHIRDQHEETDRKRFQCAFCPMTYATESSVKYHEQREHLKDSLMPCPHCGKDFLQIYLNSHIRVAHGEKSFICKFCSKGFTTKKQLKVHEDAHVGERKYKCSKCSFAAATSASLNRHLARHGERKFACDYCEKRFTLKKYLQDHIRIHTNEKPFKCEICSMVFRRRSNLGDHRIKKHGITPRKRRLCDMEASSTVSVPAGGELSSTPLISENSISKQDDTGTGM